MTSKKKEKGHTVGPGWVQYGHTLPRRPPSLPKPNRTNPRAAGLRPARSSDAMAVGKAKVYRMGGAAHLLRAYIVYPVACTRDWKPQLIRKHGRCTFLPPERPGCGRS